MLNVEIFPTIVVVVYFILFIFFLLGEEKINIINITTDNQLVSF